MWRLKQKSLLSYDNRLFNVFDLRFADRTGLEPATSAVTGRHSNQLNYRSVSLSGQAFKEPLLLLKTKSTFESAFADRTGLEPATSAVTGRHSNQLNYRSVVPFRDCKYRAFIYIHKLFLKIIVTH